MHISRQFSDEALLDSLQSGKEREEAIRFMYKNFFSSLAAFITANNGSEQDAEDIFQDVLVNFISLVTLGKFRGESSIKTFLFSMNRFCWLNELKKRGRANLRELKYNNAGEKVEADIIQPVIERESAAQLQKLLGELGESCRQVLTLFYYQGLSIKEILAQTKFENEQVVRNKKSKCLKQLETMLDEKPALKQILKNLLNG